MREIISYEKNDISKEVREMQFDTKVNLEVIEDLETMERTEEVEEALKEAYAEKEALDFLCIQLCWLNPDTVSEYFSKKTKEEIQEIENIRKRGGKILPFVAKELDKALRV
ncbi:hypothetical protein D7V86_24195 [bacterium D16-51]|nr:hypothetical protein D7V96_23520 [bacterium D16-59]RKI54063.1 hypothetical protein D7V86_24195 [bacterium D16-51]